MPNYYAHLLFGARVLGALPEPLRLRLEAERDAYTLGQYGPDPLYFCYGNGGRRVRALGREMHRSSVRPVAERLRQAVEEGRPFSAGYAAGFLCHFALDSRCHAYIKRWQADGEIIHMNLEVELDRFLMVRDGVNPYRETPLPNPQLPGGFDELLEEYVYPGVTGQQYRKGMDFYLRASTWHTRAAGGGPVRRGLLGAAARVSNRGAMFRDMALKREPGFAYIRRRDDLLALLQSEIPVAAEKLAGFFAGEALDEWFDRDFNGRT